mgnify:CR=1 FL=1
MPFLPDRQLGGLGLSSLLGKVGLPGLHERAFSPEGLRAQQQQGR